MGNTSSGQVATLSGLVITSPLPLDMPYPHAPSIVTAVSALWHVEVWQSLLIIGASGYATGIFQEISLMLLRWLAPVLVKLT